MSRIDTRACAPHQPAGRLQLNRPVPVRGWACAAGERSPTATDAQRRGGRLPPTRSRNADQRPLPRRRAAAPLSAAPAASNLQQRVRLWVDAVDAPSATGRFCSTRPGTGYRNAGQLLLPSAARGCRAARNAAGRRRRRHHGPRVVTARGARGCLTLAPAAPPPAAPLPLA